MWANLDHATDPNNTVLATIYKARNAVAQPVAPMDWKKAQISARVTLATSETTNRSARTKRKGELPSAATSTRMKNQNQYPPMQTSSAPMYQSAVTMPGVAVADVGYTKTMITVVIR